MKKALNIVSIAILVLALFALLSLAAYSINAQTANEPESHSVVERVTSANGQFVLQRSVVAGGGGEHRVNNTVAHGTWGQAAAGSDMSGGQFRVYSGFWLPDDFAPPAAGGAISGRILTDDGVGLKNAIVKLTAPDGSSRTVVSSDFGFYQFDSVETGKTFNLSVSSKRYRFGVRSVCMVSLLINIDLTGEQ